MLSPTKPASFKIGSCARFTSHTYEGQPWRQWHQVVARGDSALVVTAQGPMGQLTLVEGAAIEVAEGLMPYEEDE